MYVKDVILKLMNKCLLIMYVKDVILKLMNKCLTITSEAEQKTQDQFRSFRAQISPGDNQAAEEELKKEMK